VSSLLVERTTRGLGDAVMLSSTVSSLRNTLGAEDVRVSVSEGLQPVFHHNPDVDVLTTPALADREVDVVADCSTACAVYETDNQPLIDKNRPQVWCEAAGQVWDRSPPRLYLSAHEEAEAERFAHPLPRPIIGVGYASVDEWRNYPYMRILIAKIGAKLGGTTVLFHDKHPKLWGKKTDVRLCVAEPLRSYFTKAAACDLMVSPDTGHIHVAAALGVPVYIIDGPTDGALRMEGYEVDFERPPRYEHCGRQPSWYQHCDPCWCLHSLRPEVIIHGVERLWRRTRYGLGT